MTTEEALKLIHDDPDFVYMRRFDYSAAKLMARYSDGNGCPDHVIAAALLITEDDVELLYGEVVEQLRVLMGVPSDES